jgi:hypothetical protein
MVARKEQELTFCRKAFHSAFLWKVPKLKSEIKTGRYADNLPRDMARNARNQVLRQRWQLLFFVTALG